MLRLKDCEGLQYLARLLEHRGQEFHVLDLAVQESGTRARDKHRGPRSSMRGRARSTGVGWQSCARHSK